MSRGRGCPPLGRVPPNILVGEGATEWAVRHNIDSLISDKAAQLYKHYKKKLDMYKMSVQQVSANTSARTTLRTARG